MEAKHRLVATLLDQLAAMENHLPKYLHVASKAAFQVACGPLGRPLLLLGEDHGPAISFSQSAGKLWAALCGDAFDIGIDVADAEEFSGAYPFHRVFHARELRHALDVAAGDVENAAALLWSVKEAVAKALGCAFHRVAPLQITVYPTDVQNEGNDVYAFSVGLSGKASARFPMIADQHLWVRSLPQGKMWLSIALSNW